MWKERKERRKKVDIEEYRKGEREWDKRNRYLDRKKIVIIYIYI